MSFASCSVFLPMAHLLQPDWCSQDAAGSKLLCCSAPSPLGCSLGEPVGTSLTLHHCEMRKHPTGKRLAGQETFPVFLLVRSSLCGTAPFPLVETQICLHCCPGSGWSGDPVWKTGGDFPWNLVYVSHLVSHNVVVVRNHKCSAEWASGGACASYKCSKKRHILQYWAGCKFISVKPSRHLGWICPSPERLTSFQHQF